MIYSVYVLPNSADNWETNSPFSPALSAGQLGYIFSNTTSNLCVNYKLVSSKLLDVSEIEQSIDIFSGASKDIKAGIKIKGIGGVASSGDFSFTLESSGIIFNKLLGRTVKVTIDLANTGVTDLGTSGNTIKLVGKIRRVKPENKAVVFSCNGLLATLKEREIGTLTKYESDVYKSKIIPIVYGNMTDVNAMVRTVLDKNVKDTPNIVVDNQILTSINNILFWDGDNKKSYVYNRINDLVINNYNNNISLDTPSDMTLLYSINSASGTISLYNPSKVVFQFTTSPVLDTTSIYSFTILKKYRFIEKIDDYYIFDVINSGYLPDLSGVLGYSSGTNGGSTLTYTWRSEINDPKYLFEQSSEENSVVSPRAKPFIIKIDDELILITGQSVRTSDNTYAYTNYSINRGWNGTSISSHSAGSIITVLDSQVDIERWKFKTTIWPSSISNFGGDNTNFVIPSNLQELISMNRSNNLGDDIEFSTSHTSTKILYIDLIFPTIGIKANVINAFVLGKYVTFSSSSTYPFSMASISMLQAGSPVTTGYVQDSWYGLVESVPGAGLGMLIKTPSWGDVYRLVYPYVLYGTPELKYTVSVLAFSRSNSGGFYLNLNSEIGDLSDRDCYSLKNSTEKNSDNIYCRDATLGELSSFLSSGLTLKLCHKGDEHSTVSSRFIISNPGLLLHLEISPLENEIFVNCYGRNRIRNGIPTYTYETPNEILEHLLETELSFVDLIDNITDRSDWKQAFAITGEVRKFAEVAQSICEQGCIMLSDGDDGSLTLDSLSIPENSNNLESILLGDVLTEKGVIDYSEEWTTIDRLITDITLSYQYNDAGEYYGQVQSGVDVSEYTDKARAILDAEQKATVELPFIRDTATANKLSTLIMQYSAEPLRIVNMSLKFSKHTLRIGQWVNCNVVANGKIYLITKYSLDFARGVSISMIEMDDPNALFNTTDSTNIYQDTTDSTNIIQGV